MILEETEIYDPIAEKYRIAKNIKRQAYTMPDENGNEVSHDGIQCDIVGRSRIWPYWIPYRDFKKHNLDLINKI